MNPRFAAWLSTGADRQKLWMFFDFMSGAKRYALEKGLGVEVEKNSYYSPGRWLNIVDHAKFDKACWLYARRVDR